MAATERPLARVPRPVLLLLIGSLATQAFWHARRAGPEAQASALPPPPPLSQLELTSAGDPVALSKLSMLWLQAHDNQPGISIPFRDLDYGRVIGWLERILQLDERASYPLLAAARLYAEVPVPEKQRQMLEFVRREFLRDPDRRWPWMAHAVFVARHRLKDLPLALSLANDLSAHASAAVPSWARQMNIFVLEGMGEIEAAKVLIGGLLESGQLKDASEQQFLMRRLQDLESRSPPR
jgi:hypothetical protein